jgi:hypothetical protein
MWMKPETNLSLPSSGEVTLERLQPAVRVPPGGVVGEDILGVRENVLREM